MLSDQSIVELVESGVLGVEPFDRNLVQPASLDVRLGAEILVPFVHGSSWPLVPGKYAPAEYHSFKLAEPDNFPAMGTTSIRHLLKPGSFVLCQTIERIRLSADIQGKYEGKSSLGRIGLMTHITAGFIDPGWDGVLTLELKNVGPWIVELWMGMKIGQISFTLLDEPAQRPYGSPGLGSHYQGATTTRGIAG